MARLSEFSIILSLRIKQNTVGKLLRQAHQFPKEYAVIAASYKDHVSQLQTNYESALLSVFDKQPPDGVLLYSGSEQYYYADDRGVTFQAYGHFLHWIDVNRPGQMLCIR
ncbi:MAG: hypothetical protein CMQ16_04465, partial [Gammaproteobacteria bacterium]|nr:hypothetical protein [Gammaproteobacteria bacterium]